MALLFWQSDTFAYAESFDEGAGRYLGLRGGQMVSVSADSSGLLVKPDVAKRQMDAEMAATSPSGAPEGGTGTGAAGGAAGGVPGGTQPGSGGTTAGTIPGPAPAPRPHRFHGTVRLDPTRVGRDASRIADEVIAHLAGQVGAEVTVTLEIEATLADGATDQIVRTVTENSSTLKFDSHGFESE